MVFWESTTRCNLACVHCRRLDTNTKNTADELSTDQARAMLDSAAKMGQPVVVFSGGEPLLRNDWEQLADYARRLELPTALATNGTLIDAPLADRIAAAGFRRVAVSLDGPDPAAHDAFRGQPGAFRAAVNGLDALQNVGVAVQINVTVTTANVDRLEEMYDFAHRRRVAAMHLFMLVPVGCGVQIGETSQISARRYEEVLGWVCDRQADGAMELRATCGPHYYRIAAQRGMDTGRSRGCLAGISVVFVSHRGEVFPCGYLPVNCGSIVETPLEEIWQNSEVFSALRDFERLGGKCGDCEFKRICGGCRARAYAATGDMLAAEPSCSYRPG